MRESCSSKDDGPLSGHVSHFSTVDGSQSNYFCFLPNALFPDVSRMHICPVVLQNETRLHKIICSCQVRILAAVCHFSEKWVESVGSCCILVSCPCESIVTVEHCSLLL